MCGADFGFNIIGHSGVFTQISFRIFSTLADAFVAVAIPAALFFHDTVFDTQIHQLNHLRDAFAIHDVNVNLLEGRCYFIFPDLHARRISINVVTVFLSTT